MSYYLGKVDSISQYDGYSNKEKKQKYESLKKLTMEQLNESYQIAILRLNEQEKTCYNILKGENAAFNIKIKDIKSKT